jgi:hypothetical protein
MSYNINMDCLCYNQRKKCKYPSTKYTIKDIKDYWKRIDKLSNPKFDIHGNLLNIECSYILCEKMFKSGTEKYAIYNKTTYTFCSDKCWTDWLSSGGNLTHYAVQTPESSPALQANSPEYLEHFKNNPNLNNIPSLFI